MNFGLLNSNFLFFWTLSAQKLNTVRLKITNKTERKRALIKIIDRGYQTEVTGCSLAIFLNVSDAKTMELTKRRK